ncbi:MAG: vitamin K epoxide reductase family protein [Candidatus Terrybacteria bacterium]|nr:vitamin K epoxide reductase family protein [Candidatus Terrybacteria bacterium]
MKIPNWLTFTFLAVSFLGFLDATYLTAQHYLGTIPPCVITTGCEAVLTSAYSVIFGIPVALFGSIYYLVLFLLAVFSLDMKREVIRFAAILTPVGFLASLYFAYLQLFVIEEICTYCAVSAATSTILFILGLFIIRKSSKSTAVFQNVSSQ